LNQVIRTVLFWAVIVAAATVVWQVVRSGGNASAGHEPEISYSAFLAQVDAGEVSKVAINGNVVHGTSKSGNSFRMIVPPDHTEMMNALHQHNVEIWFRDASAESWSTGLLNLAPLLLLALLWFFMIRQRQRRSDSQQGTPGASGSSQISPPRFGS